MPTPNGPQADYPVVVGPAYSAAGTTYTPEDVLNYDQVGYLAADAGNGISASHHTLPLPSYVEVTSLTTGRTILVRVERRGPMAGKELLALSAGALAQLDAAAGTPVRVRRVNPPEDQRALLRAGKAAPLRMDTPMSLVEVLKRKLPAQGAVSLAQASPKAAGGPTQVAVPASTAAASPQSRTTTSSEPITLAALSKAPALPPLENRTTVTTVQKATPLPQALTLRPDAERKPAVPAPTATTAAKISTASLPTGRYVVQAGAFASAENANKAAGSLGAKVSAAGKLFRVRTGPFATRAEAEASLAKVRAKGYTDARIQTSG